MPLRQSGDRSCAYGDLAALWTLSYTLAGVLVATASTSTVIFKQVGANSLLSVASRIPITSAG